MKQLAYWQPIWSGSRGCHILQRHFQFVRIGLALKQQVCSCLSSINLTRYIDQYRLQPSKFLTLLSSKHPHYRHLTHLIARTARWKAHRKCWMTRRKWNRLASILSNLCEHLLLSWSFLVPLDNVYGATKGLELSSHSVILSWTTRLASTCLVIYKVWHHSHCLQYSHS